MDSTSRTTPSGPAGQGSSRLRPTDSWIDIASQSTASMLAPEAVSDSVPTLSRRPQNAEDYSHHRYSDTASRPSSAADGSSQEEYEESESDSDRVMSSSNEGTGEATSLPIADRLRLAERQASLENRSSHTDGQGPGTCASANYFTPQPNAFTHPPASSYPSRQRVRRTSTETAVARSPIAAQSDYDTRSHAPFGPNFAAHQADHDAALRASLSTLLSFGAVVKGLPRRGATGPQERAQVSNKIEPGTVRIIPESALMNQEESSRHKSRVATQSPDTDTLDKGKRKASVRSSSKERRVAKKLRTTSVDSSVSPTLLTWAVSAGVLVLVSTLSFCAGYNAGRQAGRTEFWPAEDVQACGKEAVRSTGGLRRRLLGEAASVATSARG